jgi:hypothetical protein
MALDTGAKITRFQWTELPMPKTVIDRVNQIGKNEPPILTFTNRHGDEIGDTTQDFDPGEDNDEITGVVDENTGVEQINEVPMETTDDLDGEHTGVDFDAEPTGVEDETNHDDIYDSVPQGQDNNGLGQQVPTPGVPTEPSEPSPTRRSTRLTKQWKQSYIPSHKTTKYDVAATEITTKYDVALTQVTKAMQGANNAISLAQKSIKLMSKGAHRKADMVGAVMAQLSMKAAIKKWGKDAVLAIHKEMKQLHWRDTYRPMHWHSLTKKQKDQILESHIFVEEKRDGTIKARKVIGGDKQRDYMTKEDVSSRTVAAEAVMLTCVIDAQEGRDVAVVDIPNAFAQTIVSDEDKEHRVIVRIR